VILKCPQRWSAVVILKCPQRWSAVVILKCPQRWSAVVILKCPQRWSAVFNKIRYNSARNSSWKGRRKMLKAVGTGVQLSVGLPSVVLSRFPRHFSQARRESTRIACAPTCNRSKISRNFLLDGEVAANPQCRPFVR